MNQTGFGKLDRVYVEDMRPLYAQAREALARRRATRKRQATILVAMGLGLGLWVVSVAWRWVWLVR